MCKRRDAVDVDALLITSGSEDSVLSLSRFLLPETVPEMVNGESGFKRCARLLKKDGCEFGSG